MDIKKYKGAIFDLDGTLFDSMGVWKDVDYAFFEKRNIPMPDDYQDAISDMQFKSMAVYTKERFNLPESIEDIMNEWCDLCFDAYKSSIPLKDGAYEFLCMLKEMGIKIAFATANTVELSEACLKLNKIDEFFDARAYLSETKRDKNEPDVYLLACERLSLEPSRCIVFEDILTGIQGANKGGFDTCGVYEKLALKEQEEIIKNADYYIKSFRDLL